jgi:hypothetical protein
LALTEHAKHIHNTIDKHILNSQQRSRQSMLIENESCIESGWWFIKGKKNNQLRIPECFLNILASEYSDDDIQQSTIINSRRHVHINKRYRSRQTMWIENF